MTIASTELFETFDRFSVVFGSDELQIIVDQCVYDPGLSPVICDPFPCEGPVGVYPSDIRVSRQLVGNTLIPPTPVGTLTVDAGTLEPGDYYVVVDSGRGGLLSNLGHTAFPGEPEGLFGIGRLTVVPEPATIGLAVPAAPWLFRRRAVPRALRRSVSTAQSVTSVAVRAGGAESGDILQDVQRNDLFPGDR